MSAAKGIAYFKDGHTEEITSYTNYGMSGFISFHTVSGTYFYEEVIHRITEDYSAKRHIFSRAGSQDPVDIDRIELV